MLCEAKAKNEQHCCHVAVHSQPSMQANDLHMRQNFHARQLYFLYRWPLAAKLLDFICQCLSWRLRIRLAQTFIYFCSPTLEHFD